MSKYSGFSKEELFVKIIELDEENQGLKDSQNAFMLLLDAEIEKIKNMKGLVRWWNAAKLVYNLIVNYEEWRDMYLKPRTDSNPDLSKHLID